MLNHEKLKHRQREERHTYSEYLSIRVHRALSWLKRAEMCTDDLDAKFIFLWISFNAAYSHEIPLDYQTCEQQRFNDFIKRLFDLDHRKRLHNLVWSQFPQSIRILLDNRYVFQPFWDYANGKLPEQQWADKFNLARKAASKALGKGDSPVVLSIALSRLYTLRNQLVHGGATWNSSVNRDQIRDCTKLVSCLVPIIIEIMMDNPIELWGQPRYLEISN